MENFSLSSYMEQRLIQDNWDILNQTYKGMGEKIDEIIANSSLVLDNSFFMLSGNYMDMLKIVEGK